MGSTSRFRNLVAVAAAVVAAGTLAAGPAAADGHRHGRLQVLSSTLSSPKGVTLAPNGDPVVAQGAFGAPGPVLEFLHSSRTTQALTEPARFGDVAAARDGSGWALGAGAAEEGAVGDTWLYHRAVDGTVSKLVDIAAYQASDPDPEDQDQPPFPTESNPYGLAAARNGDALVTDAANNDLLRVTAAGKVTTVARFGTEPVSTSHLPADQRPPVARIDAEAVPTTVTLGPDGYAYVGELKGFPFRPGSSRIWRVNPNAVGAHCKVGVPSAQCSSYARGFTAIQDIAFNRRTGTLYVYELAKAGVLAFEAALESGAFPPAVLLKVGRHHRTELVPGQLSQPGGVAVSWHGRVTVTDQVFTGGRLAHVRT